MSIGLGLLLYELASYVALRLALTDAFGIDGWFNYAPPGAKLASPELGGGAQTAQVIVDVVAVALWVLGSSWLFRTPTTFIDQPDSPA